MPTNQPTGNAPLHEGEAGKLHGRSTDQPGYETTDVNVRGVVVFLSGLSFFVLVFFGFCFVMGRVINTQLDKADGPVTKWNQMSSFAGAAATGGKREDLATNPEMQQKALQQMTSTFPTPRLETDDGNQDLADLHAREDLLLDHYSAVEGQSAVRIPIARAMQLIAAHNLPVQAEGPAPVRPQFAGVVAPQVQVPLTTGFARTGYELDVMEARAQRLNFGKAQSAEHAELHPVR